MTSPFKIKPHLRIHGFRVYLLTRVLQRSVMNVENSDTKLKDHEYELPATWDRRSGSPGPGFVSARDRGGPGASRHQADLERGDGRGCRPHALAEPLQDRPRRCPLHRGA